MNEMLATDKPSSPTFTELNVRQEKGKPYFIRLHDTVVKQLERQLVDNPASTGLLLGSIEVNENCTIAVEEFQPATRPDELIRVREGGLQKVVGFYRGHSKEKFTLDPRDRALFQRCFPKECRLALLVKPPAEDIGTAMFFLGENGALVADRSTVEFPFNLHALGAEEPPEAGAKSVMEMPPAPPTSGRGGLLWKFAVSGVVVIASVFGLSELRVFDRSPEPPPLAQPPVERASPPPKQPPVVLPETAPSAVIESAPVKPPKPVKPKPAAATVAQRKTAPPLGPPAPVRQQAESALPSPSSSQPPAITREEAAPSAALSPAPAAPVPYTPPAAIRQFAPVPPEAILRFITEEVVVHVRVNVDAAGKVIAAVPVDAGNRVAAALAISAVNSIRRWEFAPAHRGGEKVPGELVLGFRFRK